MTTFNVSTVVAGEHALPVVPVVEKIGVFKKQAQYLHGISDTPHLLQSGYDHGFINAAVTAFAHHRHLSLAPDHFWLLITQAVSQHVGAHEEELRDRFVSHAGTNELVVYVDHFVLHGNNDWSQPVDLLTHQIRGNCKPGVADMCVSDFSTTTGDERVACMMTLMKTTENYFEYTMVTRCGIPSVTLEGTLNDWAILRHRAEDLINTLCLPQFASTWLATLLPVLDALYASARGGVEGVVAEFWQNFVKQGSASGTGTCITGWINVFFPYTGRGKQNPMLNAHNWGTANWVDTPELMGGCGRLTLASTTSKPLGLQVEEFPGGVVKVPVKWKYMQTLIPLQFCSGFLGVSQNNLTLRPEIGWMVVDAEP